jgi:hypothetical protein
MLFWFPVVWSLFPNNKKTGLPLPGNPAFSWRPVAFRPRLATGLAFYWEFNGKQNLELLSRYFYKRMKFFYGQRRSETIPNNFRRLLRGFLSGQEQKGVSVAICYLSTSL